MTSNINQERWIASNKDSTLYRIIEVLDRYDFGNIGDEHPGEYASEAKEIYAKRYAIDTKKQVTRLLKQVIKDYFGFRAEMILARRYNNAASEIYSILKQD